jgi:DNA-binding MarR family transcriptional regulator
MEDSGWIRRRYGADPDDRRNVHVVLSAKGRRETASLVAEIGGSLARNRSVVSNLRTALEPFLQ